jgi:hypothetical protein
VAKEEEKSACGGVLSELVRTELFKTILREKRTDKE